MIIPVPEWESEIVWPSGSLAQSGQVREIGELKCALACDRPLAQPTSTA